MKFNFDIKNKKAGFEADVEKIVEKGMEQHEKSWKDKFNTKHNAKKEILVMKHKQKLELENIKPKKKSESQIKIEEQIRKEQNEKAKEKQKNQRIIRNISIILIFIYGLFCIVGFHDNHIIAAVISLIQICLLITTILMCEDIFHLFKKDYKILFIMSILLTVAWSAFVV